VDNEPSPFILRHEDGRVYGRGVEDNQQGLVGSVFAALAFVASGLVPRRTVKLLFVADEEVGSKYGIQHILTVPGVFRKNDLIVVPDGGSIDGSEIEVAEKNICWLKVTTKGKQTHAAMPDQGNNAFLAACDLALRLHDLETEVFTARDKLFEPDRTTINPTKKEANVPNVNTIPGDDVFCVDMRILPNYPVEMALAEVSKKMREVEKLRGVTIGYEVIQSNESKTTAADAPVVKALASAVRDVYGVHAKPIGIGGGTVGAYLRNAGYDCAIWSRIDETAHQPNEYSKLENIIGDAKVFATLMMT
jgi:succinyl-diaminopimelate desuccinylase